jgi:hypothetical protein
MLTADTALLLDVCGQRSTSDALEFTSEVLAAGNPRTPAEGEILSCRSV